MKKSRSLRQSIQKEEIPSWIVFIDTETVANEGGWQDLLLGCYEIWNVNRKTGIPINNRKLGELVPRYRGFFIHEDEFYELLKGIKECRCIAHNWQFDASVIKLGSKYTIKKHKYWIDIEKDTIFPLENKQSPFSVRIKWEGGFAHFIDNTNFHKTSLANLGESFGISKLEMPKLDRDLLTMLDDVEPYLKEINRMSAESMKDWLSNKDLSRIFSVIRYCKRDVEVLRKSWFYIFQFSHNIAGVTPGLTVASMTKRCYQRRWLPDFTKRYGEKFIGNLDKPEVSIAEEKAYVGGRTETFFNGQPTVHSLIRKYDVNSMYPYCMLGPMPVQFSGVASPSDLISALNKYGGHDGPEIYLAKVTVNIPKEGIGWLGWEGVKLEGRGLCFPCGKFTLWAWQPMIDIAYKEGWIIKYHKVFAYRARNIFRKYVLDIYDLRKKAKENGDMPKALLLKYLLNSLYGKFAQRNFGKWVKVTDERELEWQEIHREDQSKDGFRWRYCKYSISDNYNDDIFYDYLDNGEHIYRYEPPEEGMGSSSIASIAGFITSMARSVLWWAMRYLRENDYGIYMVDTDSLITDGELPSNFIGKDIGNWELEEVSEPHLCEFRAPKHYSFADITKIKGIREAKRGQSIYRQPQFSKWSTNLKSKSQGMSNRLEKGALVKDIIKIVTGENKKRIVIGENMFNLPLELNEN